jgi:hypothetical protein
LVNCVHVKAAFGTIFKMTCGFRKNYKSHSWLSVCSNIFRISTCNGFQRQQTATIYLLFSPKRQQKQI